MNVLLIDIGNTRVKWSVLRAGRLERGRALAHDRDARALAAVIRRALPPATGTR